MAQPTNNNVASSGALPAVVVSDEAYASKNAADESSAEIEKNTEAEETSSTVEANKTRKRKAIKSRSSHEPPKKRARTAKKSCAPFCKIRS